jgi:hypothetical protein
VDEEYEPVFARVSAKQYIVSKHSNQIEEETGTTRSLSTSQQRSLVCKYWHSASIRDLHRFAMTICYYSAGKANVIGRFILNHVASAANFA